MPQDNRDIKRINVSVVLFGLTGQGNSALRGLLAAGCKVEAVFTRKEPGPFPYYAEEQLDSFAQRMGIPVYYEMDAGKVGSPDLLLVSTYHRKIPDEIIARARVAANFHPSLLPKYRGATPTRWALENGDSETGVTVHALTSVLDQGEVYLQKKIEISPGETDGSLRKKLADLVETMVPVLVRRVETLHEFAVSHWGPRVLGPPNRAPRWRHPHAEALERPTDTVISLETNRTPLGWSPPEAPSRKSGPKPVAANPVLRPAVAMAESMFWESDKRRARFWRNSGRGNG